MDLERSLTGFSGINTVKKSFFSSTYPLHKAAEVGNAKMVSCPVLFSELRGNPRRIPRRVKRHLLPGQVKLLLEQGANPALKNSAGKTAQEAFGAT